MKSSNFIKKSPFQNVVNIRKMTNDIINNINESSSTINTTKTNQQPAVVLAPAYVEGKAYFKNLRNIIKSLGFADIDSYGINISDAEGHSNDARYFKVTIKTKNGYFINSFEVDRNNIPWDNIINNVASRIIDSINKYLSINQNNNTTPLVGQDLLDKVLQDREERKETKPVENNIVESTTQDNVVYYPMIIDNSNSGINNETPELEEAKQKKQEVERNLDDLTDEELYQKCKDKIRFIYENPERFSEVLWHIDKKVIVNLENFFERRYIFKESVIAKTYELVKKFIMFENNNFTEIEELVNLHYR